jgi:hypothetical protein
VLRGPRLPRLCCAPDPPPASWRTTPEATTATPEATCATPEATSATRFSAPLVLRLAFLRPAAAREGDLRDFRDFVARLVLDVRVLFLFALEAVFRPLAAGELFRFLLLLFRVRLLRAAISLLP